jgi:hypothetical protein
MELESATQELYGLAPARFTSARDAMAAEARQAGHPELASSLKKLRKPSVGAWLANLLVLEQTNDVERLVSLGAELRAPKHKLDGKQIRRVSKEKGDSVSRLVRDAKAKASRAGQTVSTAASQELEATLEAAFADPKAAENLLAGCLSGGLQYSGLGLGELASTMDSKSLASARRAKPNADQNAAARHLEKAQREAEQADAQVEKLSQAAVDATEKLTRLKSAETLAKRRSKEAHANLSAAKKKRDKLR